MPNGGPQQPEAELGKYGVPAPCLRSLSGQASSKLIEYLDLLSERRPGEFLPDGVAESQDRPLLYYVNGSRLVSPADEQENLRRLRHALGCRGHRAYLAVVRPGQLDVVPVSLDHRTPEWKIYRPGTSEAVTFFSRLALGQYDGKGEPAHADHVFQGMLKLLAEAGKRLAESPAGLDKLDALSLIGRALFFRFLCDRLIVKAEYVKSIAPEATDLFACFDSARNAFSTCRWLDKTFNGDFLPLTDGGSLPFFEKAARQSQGKVFLHLGAIMRGYEAVPGGYQTHFGIDWSDFDFAHVPVGLMSQVYERFCWKWDPATAQSTSVHYTPRHIAATLVGEVFERLPNAHQCSVLDPACGGGVFLVLAFRELYRARWEATGHRPDTRAIREIMLRQLKGFEISESAVRLTALSLYLTAIELDPEPIPPEKLKFNKLRGEVLFNFWRRGRDPAEGPVIGCLGAHVPEWFDGQFDVVLSNPPSTSLPKKAKHIRDKEERQNEEKRLAALAEEFTFVSRAVIRRKGEPQLAKSYHNPDKAPDLPILWRATEWCRPGGRIAMALPARILFKQRRIASRARETLLKLVEVTGIINGSNLSDTPVWPEMGQPFLLLFARSRKPKPNCTLQFISPHLDSSLSQRGQLRIDSKSAQPIEAEEAPDEPWLWKALAIGTQLDVEIIRRIKATKGRPVGTYWKKDLHLSSSNGYMIKPDQTQMPASFLQGLPDLTAAYSGPMSVDVSTLSTFERSTACRPRKPEVYQAPLTLIKQSPGPHREEGWALLSLHPVAFSQDFYGYSAASHPDGDTLARYLLLFCHSLVWSYYALLTAPIFGAERRIVYKTDLDGCPIIPLERLSRQQHDEIKPLSDRLLRREAGVFADIDSFFGAVFSLDKLDLEVIHDTLQVCLPYAESRERACEKPKEGERKRFMRRLERLLKPFFEVVGEEPEVVPWPEPGDPICRMPYGVLLIRKRGRAQAQPDRVFSESVLPLAIETGASQIIQQIEGGLLVATLKQYRYWTPSRARLCAAEILRNHMGVFGG